MQATKEFELFEASKHCDAVLPVNPVEDEYTFVRFAPLFVQGSGRTEAVVLPRDIVNPQLMGYVLHTLRQFPYEVDQVAIRGGSPLNPQWDKWTAPSPPELKKVVRHDRYEFISRPTVQLNGGIYEPRLTPHHVTVRIDNLHAFLSHPTVHIDSYGSYRVALTEKNVEELSTVGISEVEVVSGDGHRAIYVTTDPNESATGYTSSSRTLGELGEPGEVVFPTGGRPQIWPQLPNCECVLYLPYRQTWELLGYSRGELLNSLSLGPQEETTIEIFTWDRFKRMREDTTTVEEEGALEVTFTDKDSMECMKEITQTSNWQAGLNANVVIPDTPITIGGNFSASDALNAVNKGTHQTISEAVRKASARIKTTRQTKVTESEEFGREEKVTRKIKNPNMCRTLNMDYFAILATYKVTTQLALDQVQLCVLADVALYPHLDRNFLLLYEGPLRDALLFREVYEKGFDAARKLAAWEKLCAIKCFTCECDKPLAPRPTTNDGGGATTPVDTTTVTNAAQYLRQCIATLANASPSAICALANDIPRWLRSMAPKWLGGMNATEKQQYENEWQQAKPEYHRWLYRKTVMELGSMRFWNAALDFYNAKTPQGTPDTSVATLQRMIGAADPNILVDLFNLASIGVRAYGKAIEMIVEVLTNFCVNLVPLKDNIGFNDGGLGTAFGQAQTALDAYKAAVAIQSQPPSKTADEAKKKEAEQVFEKAAPEYPPKDIAEAQVLVETLARHIDSNYAYYREAIWRRMEPRDRLMHLRVLGNLSAYVHNDVLGFVGLKAALPYRMTDDISVYAWFVKNVLENEGLKNQSTSTTITLPTKGVTMEARLGQCDCCEEFIMKHRELDLKQKMADVNSAEERAKQEALETERYHKRLQQTPPMLEDPDPNQSANRLMLSIRQEKES